MKVFHGTTADCLPDILKNGLSIDKGGENWTVSDSYVYFWSPAKLLKMGEGDTKEQAIFFARQRAYDSGSFGLGFAKDCRAVILEVEVRAKDLEDDTSCPHMEGAVRLPYSVPASAIKSISISNDLSLLKGYFLAFSLDRDLSARELSPLEEKIARVMSKAEIYDMEDLIEWQPYK